MHTELRSSQIKTKTYMHSSRVRSLSHIKKNAFWDHPCAQIVKITMNIHATTTASNSHKKKNRLIFSIIKSVFVNAPSVICHSSCLEMYIVYAYVCNIYELWVVVCESYSVWLLFNRLRRRMHVFVVDRRSHGVHNDYTEYL